MKNTIALGLFVISVLFGMALVIFGTVNGLEIFVWAGMIIIAIGVINLVVKISFPEPVVPVVIGKTKRKLVKRKSRKKRVVRKVKKSAKRKKIKRKR